MTPQALNLVVDDADLEPQAPPVLTRIFVVGATPGIAEMVARSLSHDDGVSTQSRQASLGDLVADATFDLSGIDVIMFEIAQGNDGELAALRSLREQGAGRVKFLGVTSETLSLAVAKQLMDAGVDEVMPLRIGRPELADATQIAPELDAATTRRGRDLRNGVIVAATQTRGGIGTTSFVLNLATMLTERSRKDKSEPLRVAVVDLDFQNGVLAASLDLQDNGAVLNFLKAQDLADVDTIGRMMQPFRDRFDVLPAPTELAPFEAMTPEMMASLLDELRQDYDFVILDLPRAITHWMNAVLSRADQMYILTDVSVHSVRQARRLKDAFGDDHVSLPIEAVVSMQKKPLITPESVREAEKFLDQKLRYWVAPDDRTSRRAADKGEPQALTQRKSPTVRSMQPIAQDLRGLAAADARRMA